MMNFKLTLFLGLLAPMLNAFSQYKFETELYDCIKSELHEKGLDLEEGLNAFENQLINIGYISDSISVYDALRIQSNCDIPLVIKQYVPDIDIRTNNYFSIRTFCYEQNSTDKANSKYYKVVRLLESLQSEKEPSLIWKEMDIILDEESYEHPFYRMNALITLHSWSVDSYEKYGSDNSCFD